MTTWVSKRQWKSFFYLYPLSFVLGSDYEKSHFSVEDFLAPREGDLSRMRSKKGFCKIRKDLSHVRCRGRGASETQGSTRVEGNVLFMKSTGWKHVDPPRGQMNKLTCSGAERERERTCRLRRSGRTACSQFVETAARLLLCSESEAEQEFFKPYHVHRKKYVSMCCAPLPRHHPLPLRGKKRIELRLIEESTLFNRWPLVSPGWKPG